MTFGEKFRGERERMGLTQQEVADRLGLHRRMISRYENDLSLPRSKDGYYKMAALFDVDVNYLLTDDMQFVADAAGKYGRNGRRQAQDLINDMTGLFAGGTLSPQDEDAVMKALQQIYWDAKARNVVKYASDKHKESKDE